MLSVAFMGGARTRTAVVIDPTVVTVTTVPTTLSGSAGDTPTLLALAKNAAGTTLTGKTFTAVSSNTGIATVSVTGSTVTVTFVAAGSCTVTVTCETVDSTPVTVAVSAGPVVPTASEWDIGSLELWMTTAASIPARHYANAPAATLALVDQPLADSGDHQIYQIADVTHRNWDVTTIVVKVDGVIVDHATTVYTRLSLSGQIIFPTSDAGRGAVTVSVNSYTDFLLASFTPPLLAFNSDGTQVTAWEGTVVRDAIAGSSFYGVLRNEDDTARVVIPASDIGLGSVTVADWTANKLVTLSAATLTAVAA